MKHRDYHTGLTQKGKTKIYYNQNEKKKIEHKEKTVKAARGKKSTNIRAFP